MARKPAISVTIDRVADVAIAIDKLATTRVYVGFPADKSSRDDGPITSAALGYIHEHGAPEAHIPARPFLIPTKNAEVNRVIEANKQAGIAAFGGQPEKVERILSKLGQQVADAARDRIIAGIPPALKDATIIGRITRTAAYKSAKPARRKAMRAKQLAAGATPLIDSGQMLRAITWVLRKVGRK